MKGFRLLLFILLLSGAIQAQSIKGKLIDVENKPLAGATLRLTSIKDSSFNYNQVSTANGDFLFSDLPRDSFYLRISSIGYEDFRMVVKSADTAVSLGNILIPKSTVELGGITLISKTPPTTQKGDTTQFSASQFKVNPDANVEDLIKKMPGITVDKDGNVTAQGEQIRKVTIDGRDFFGDDASAALRNLPSEIVDKIQVFDKLSEQAELTGVDDGNSQKAINIITRAGMRNGQFGRIYAGYGTDERYQAGGNMSFFKDNRRISIVGLTNNINQQNFGSQDLLGLTSSNSGGGNRGGGSRGGGGPRGGNNNFRGGNTSNFMVGQQNGISKTNAIGINYTDKWGTKTTVTGSYFFNNSNTNNSQISSTQSFVKADSTLFLNDSSLSRVNNYNHRINLRFEYKIDSSNTLMIVPSLSFQNNHNVSNINSISFYDLLTGLESQSIRRYDSRNKGYNFNNSIIFRHGFKKRGRSMSVNLNTSFNERDGESLLESINTYFNGSSQNDSINQLSNNDTKGRTISTNLVYTEPIGKRGQLQFNVNPSFTRNTADRLTYNFDELTGKHSSLDTAFSNKFDNNYNTLNSGVTYRLGERDNQFSFGLNYQRSNLQSDQSFPSVLEINRTFSNVLPNIQYRKKVSPRSNINLSYRANVNAPSINQLQDVIENTNPLRLSTGNPALEQQYMHRLSARYIYTYTQKGQSFFANLFFQRADNYVANATYTASADSVLSHDIILFKGSQLIKPVNLDGYWNIRSFLTYGQPVAFLKSNVNLNAGLSYSRIPGLVNNVSTFTNNYNYSAGAVIASNISEYIDFNLSYNINFSVVKNSLQPQLDQNSVSQNANVQFNLLSKTGWFLQSDINFQSYSGLTGGFNQSFTLWNAGIGKKFLKDRRGELKLTGFDILKNNQSISRDVGDTYIQDTRNLVLQRYFMLTFTYSLRNFGQATKAANRGQNRPN